MPRDDFNKFTAIINKYDNSYILSSIEDDDYYHAFAKLSDSRTFLSIIPMILGMSRVFRLIYLFLMDCQMILEKLDSILKSVIGLR